MDADRILRELKKGTITYTGTIPYVRLDDVERVLESMRDQCEACGHDLHTDSDCGEADGTYDHLNGFGECGCPGTLQEQLAEAWDTGYAAGDLDGHNNNTGTSRAFVNPYRDYESIEFPVVAEKDARALPENVALHTMMDFYQHEDGRGCAYHARLGKWTFNDVYECTRDHDPENNVLAKRRS